MSPHTMEGPSSRIADGAVAGATTPRFLSLRSGWLLAFPAAAMELLYVLVLRLGNLKERVETFLLLALLLGILYFVSLHLAEKIAPGRRLLIFVFLAAAVFRLTLF